MDDYFPPLNFVVRLARCLDVSLEYLVFGREKDISLQLENVHKLLKNAGTTLDKIQEKKKTAREPIKTTSF